MPNQAPIYEIQNEFINDAKAPSVIFGYSGTGKSFALQQKYFQVIKQNNISPDEIIYITLKNNAALAIRKQIKKILNWKQNHLPVGTFNYVLSQILRDNSEKVGLKPIFTIYDAEDSQKAIENILGQFKLSDKDYDIEIIYKQFRYIKNQFIKPEDYKFSDKSKFNDNIIKIFYEYNKRLQFNNSVDYEDIALKVLELFQNKTVLQSYKKKYKFIFIDDFQDISPAQLEITKLLYNKNLFIAYDENQIINEWKGFISNIKQEIPNYFPKIKSYDFNKNVRNTDLIFNAAISILPQDQNQEFTSNDDKNKVIVIKCFDEKDEAYQICKRIKEIISEEKLTYKDFAVLYRIHSQARIYDEYFKYENVPVQIVRKLDLFKTKEV
ncbi:MAG TPA: ATP-dependent helicase, partial [Ignavibacteriales bacterium]|nr:ATP-dependent helicase [Ignavibacteriales bacterium]